MTDYIKTTLLFSSSMLQILMNNLESFTLWIKKQRKRALRWDKPCLLQLPKSHLTISLFSSLFFLFGYPEIHFYLQFLLLLSNSILNRIKIASISPLYFWVYILLLFFFFGSWVRAREILWIRVTEEDSDRLVGLAPVEVKAVVRPSSRCFLLVFEFLSLTMTRLVSWS